MIFSFVLHIYIYICTKSVKDWSLLCSASSSVGEEISDFGFGFEISPRIPRKDQSRSQCIHRPYSNESRFEIELTVMGIVRLLSYTAKTSGDLNPEILAAHWFLCGWIGKTNWVYRDLATAQPSRFNTSSNGTATIGIMRIIQFMQRLGKLGRGRDSGNR